MTMAEQDRWRILDDAQLEADTMFAQYQMSQLLASGDHLGTIVDAVLEELLRSTDARIAALWLAEPGGADLALVSMQEESAAPVAERPVPSSFRSPIEAHDWARSRRWPAVTLDQVHDSGERGLERETVGFIAVGPGGSGRSVDYPGRFLGLVRHELATAFRAAQVRETLARERAVLSAILDGASDPILAVDGSRMVVRLNRAAIDLLGPAARTGDPCDVVLGCRLPGAGAALRCGERCPFEEILGGGASIVRREREVDARSGAVPVAGNYARMSDAPGAVAVFRDLRPAREVDELKANFVAGVSHELRTPLALIGGYVQTLLRFDPEPGQRRHYLDQIERTTARLTGLVNQLLEINHLDSDRLRLERVPVVLDALVADVVEVLVESGIGPQIGTRIPTDLPPFDADPERLGQVVSNLLANAAKYGGAGATVVVVARMHGEEVLVSVVDDGPGIPADERDRMFERFQRGKGVSQSRVPGSGLGLYLCRRIIEAHGGRIWFDDVEVGTSVSFTLPIAAPRSVGTP